MSKYMNSKRILFEFNYHSSKSYKGLENKIICTSLGPKCLNRK